MTVVSLRGLLSRLRPNGLADSPEISAENRLSAIVGSLVACVQCLLDGGRARFVI